MKEFYFSKGNRKLSRDTLIWNLPRGKTCPGAGECLKWCYEIKIERIYPNVRESRERNLKFSKSKDFVDKIVEYLKKRKEKRIRIHESGDFYSEEYFKKWIEIAKRCPNKIFYTYTKSFVVFNVYPKDLPKNFIVIQSYGSKDDSKIDPSRNTARVIENLKEKKPYEYLCPYEKWKETHDEKYQCGKGCLYCQSLKNNGKIHVVFIRH